MSDLEIELITIMVKLVVRYEDGMERIQAALDRVVEVGIEMT